MLDSLRQLILSRTGLVMRDHDDASLRSLLQERLRARGLADLQSYHRLLRVHSERSETEWRELAAVLTTSESFFFRDDGQVQTLREHLLPELIERGRQTKILRLWSAGCSTGEEPYTLAMLLDELLPERDDWRLTILGTDLNEQALAQARRGQYREWSLRRLPPDLRARYFDSRNSHWELSERVRSMVTFRSLNLLDDSSSLLPYAADMDLIVCRNVFIYFSQPVIARVLERFREALNEGGYLLVGHGELHGQNTGRLRARVFAHSLAYRLGGNVERVEPLPAAPAAPQPEETAAEVLQEKLGRGDDAEIVALREPALCSEPEEVRALCLAAEAHGNGGRLEEAELCCRQALQLDATNPWPHFLLAQLAQERGDREAAKRALRTVVYLDKEAAPAYVELGDLYEQEGNARRARSMRAAARELLKELPRDATMPPYGTATAADLGDYLAGLGEAV